MSMDLRPFGRTGLMVSPYYLDDSFADFRPQPFRW
jgi:hypothetical protein